MSHFSLTSVYSSNNISYLIHLKLYITVIVNPTLRMHYYLLQRDDNSTTMKPSRSAASAKSFISRVSSLHFLYSVTFSVLFYTSFKYNHFVYHVQCHEHDICIYTEGSKNYRGTGCAISCRNYSY